MRGVAVLAVVFAHFGMPGFQGGFVGVDVFFAISGFLLIGFLHSELSLTGNVSLIAFYGRRARRILPAALFVILSTAISAHFVLNELAAGEVREDAAWAVLFVINLLFIDRGADYFAQYDAVSPLQHYWSLAVEEQFYVVIPLIFALAAATALSRRKRRATRWLALLTLCSFVWCIYATNQSTTSAYFSSLTRAWQIGIAGLLAIVLKQGQLKMTKGRSQVSSAVGVGLLVVSVGFLRGDSYPGFYALLPIGASLALLAAGADPAQRTIVQRVLESRLLNAVGLVSFSLYLWHWPVLTIGSRVWPQALGSDASMRIPALLAFSLILAAFSWWLIERPFMKLSWHDFSKRSPQCARVSAIGGLLGAAILVMFSVLTIFGPDSASRLHVSPIKEQKLKEWQLKVSAGLELKKLPDSVTPPLKTLSEDRESMSCLTVDVTNMSRCQWGSKDAPKSVFVLGDSHAHMWITALRYAFAPQKFSLRYLGMSGCPNAGVIRVDPEWPDRPQECTDHQSWVLSLIKKERPDIVVLSDSAGFPVGLDSQLPAMTAAERQRWERATQSMLIKVRELASRVIVIGQTPRGRSLETCLPANLKLSSCLGNDEVTSRLRDAERRMARKEKASFVDPAPWLCVGLVCPPVIDNTIVMFDDNHLTVSIERRLAPLLAHEIHGS